MRQLWTLEGISTLKQLYGQQTREQILAEFPNRDWGSISSKATRVGLHRRFPRKRWVSEEYVLAEDVRKIVAWAIAFEGSIYMHKHVDRRRGYVNYVPIISLGGVNQALIRKFHQLVKYGHIAFETRIGQNKPLWRWAITNMYGCYTLLKQVQSFLPAKQEQCRLVLEFIEYRLENWAMPHTRSEGYYQTVKKLNERIV